MGDKYILNDDHTVRPCEDIVEWGRAMESSRRVASTELDGVRVSTVFLGLDHSFGGAAPLLFETMIFGGPHDGDQWRYYDWDEAVRGHEAACKIAGISDV